MSWQWERLASNVVIKFFSQFRTITKRNISCWKNVSPTVQWHQRIQRIKNEDWIEWVQLRVGYLSMTTDYWLLTTWNVWKEITNQWITSLDNIFLLLSAEIERNDEFTEWKIRFHWQKGKNRFHAPSIRIAGVYPSISPPHSLFFSHFSCERSLLHLLERRAEKKRS